MGLLVQSVQPTVSFLTAESSKLRNVRETDCGFGVNPDGKIPCTYSFK
jgi:hypothetical protein